MEENQIELSGNKYFTWYWNICNRAKDRILPERTYSEKHHIYPKSIYGQNKELVKLTAREHYIVHLVLWWGLRTKFGSSDIKTKKMCCGFIMMNRFSKNQERYSSKTFLNLRMAVIEYNKNKIITSEQIAKWKVTRYDNKKWIVHTEASKRLISLSRLGKTGYLHTEESKRLISLAHLGKKLSDKTKKLLRDINIGKVRSDESKIKQSKSCRLTLSKPEIKIKNSLRAQGMKNSNAKRYVISFKNCIYELNGQFEVLQKYNELFDTNLKTAACLISCIINKKKKDCEIIKIESINKKG